MPSAFYESIGYRPLGKVAIRVDIVERLASKAWHLSQTGPFPVSTDLMNLVGGSFDDVTKALNRLGYREHGADNQILFSRHKPLAGLTGKHTGLKKSRVNPDSPFAKLASLRDDR